MRHFSEAGELTRFCRKYWKFVCLAGAYSPSKRYTGVIPVHDLHEFSIKSVGRFSYKEGPPDDWGKTYIIDGFFRSYSEKHPDLYYNNERNIAPFHHASPFFKKFKDHFHEGEEKGRKEIERKKREKDTKIRKLIKSRGSVLFANIRFLWRLRDEIKELGATPTETITWSEFYSLRDEIKKSTYGCHEIAAKSDEIIRQLNAFADLVYSLQIKAMLKKWNASQKQQPHKTSCHKN